MGQTDSLAQAGDNTNVRKEDIAHWRREYAAVPARQTLEALLSKQDILENTTLRRSEVDNVHIFNHKLSVDPMHQQQSGQCWLFAALNMARIAFCKKYNVEEYQYSQSYLLFWDLLERSNVFLETAIELVEEDFGTRSMDELLSKPVQRGGGEWEFAVNLFERYGLVPQAVLLESHNSNNTGTLIRLIDTQLREFCMQLRKLYASHKSKLIKEDAQNEHEAVQAAITACRSEKKKMLSKIYNILALSLGTPPLAEDTFKYEYYNKAGQYQCMKMTPIELYKSLAPAFEPSQSFAVINEPNYALGKLYAVQKHQNIQNGVESRFVNTKIEDLEEMVVAMIKADEPVWMACDAFAATTSDTGSGVWDVHARDLENTFGTAVVMNKAERLQTGESSRTHAMMFSGVHFEDGKPVRYRITNSSGPDAGAKGYFMCTAEWFREYVYEIVVPRKFAPPHLLEILDAGNPVVLPPWGRLVKG